MVYDENNIFFFLIFLFVVVFVFVFFDRFFLQRLIIRFPRPPPTSAETAFVDGMLNALTLSVRYRDFVDRFNDSAHSRRGFLLHTAVEKVAVMPFAYAAGTWHSSVFSGHFTPKKRMNDFWWSKRYFSFGLRISTTGATRVAPRRYGFYCAPPTSKEKKKSYTEIFFFSNRICLVASVSEYLG